MNRGSMARNASGGIQARFSSRPLDARRGNAADVAATTASGPIDRSSLRLTGITAPNSIHYLPPRPIEPYRRSTLCVEDQLQQLSELTHSDRLRAGGWPWPVRVHTMHNHDIERGDDHDVVTAISLGSKTSIGEARVQDEIAVDPYPPEISVARITVVL